MSDSVWHHGCPWNSPGQNTGVGSLSLLQELFPTQGLNPGLLHCRWFFTSWTTREAQEYWSGQPIPSPAGLPDPGIKLGSTALLENWGSSVVSESVCPLPTNTLNQRNTGNPGPEQQRAGASWARPSGDRCCLLTSLIRAKSSASTPALGQQILEGTATAVGRQGVSAPRSKHPVP